MSHHTGSSIHASRPIGRLRAMVRKETMHLLRDRRDLIMVVLAPSFLLLTLSYVFSFDIERFAIAVWDQDQTALSRQYVAALVSDGTLVLERTVSSYAEVEAVLIAGDVRAVVVIPPGFQQSIARRERVTVQALIDGINPTAASQCVAELEGRSANMALQEMLGGATGTRSPIEIAARMWYNAGSQGLYSMVPGLLALVMAMPVFQIGQALTREKERGTMEGLIATPVTAAELMLGKLAPYMLAGTVGALLAAGVGVGWFHVPFRGSLGLFVLLTVDFLFAGLGTGLFLANFLSSQQATQIVVTLVFFIPGFFMSGLLTPVNRASLFGRAMALVLPTSHYIRICRAIFLKGVGLADLWEPAASLLGIGVVTLIGSILTFRKRLG